MHHTLVIKINTENFQNLEISESLTISCILVDIGSKMAKRTLTLIRLGFLRVVFSGDGGEVNFIFQEELI